MYKHLSPSPFSLNFAITAGGNASYSCVQLIIRVWPFKTEQRVSKWRRVSLIELRPINNNSLAVAWSLLFSALRLIFVCSDSAPVASVIFTSQTNSWGSSGKVGLLQADWGSGACESAAHSGSNGVFRQTPQTEDCQRLRLKRQRYDTNLGERGFYAERSDRGCCSK